METETTLPLVAIETRYLGPTNHRGSRVVATTCNGHRLVGQYDASCNAYEAHRRVAMALAEKMAWWRQNIAWHGGATKAGYVFVQGIE